MAKVYIEIQGKDGVTPVVRKMDKNTMAAFNNMKAKAAASSASMGASLQKLKTHWLAITAAMATVIFTVGKVMRKFAEWEVSLTDMKKVTSESLASIKAKIMGLHPALGTSIELVKGYYQVISAGVKNPVKALKLLITASKTAKAAHVEQSEVIKGLTKLMAGYQGEIKNVSEAADVLFAIEKEGQTTVAELIPVIGGLAKMSHDLGISQNELGASMAQITQTAGDTAEAATQYQGILIALMKPTKAMQAAIKEMGYDSSQAAIKSLGLVETLRRLKEQTHGSAAKMAAMFGRLRGLKGISALASNDFENLTNKLKEMGKKTGSAAAAWTEYEKTATSAWDSLKASVEKVTIAIGKGLAPAAKQWAHWLSVAAEYGAKIFGASNTVIATLNKQKEAIEAEIAQIEAIKLSMEGLKSFGTVIADSEGEKRLKLLNAQLKNVNATIANYNKELNKPPKPDLPFPEDKTPHIETMKEYIAKAREAAAILNAPPFDWEKWLMPAVIDTSMDTYINKAKEAAAILNALPFDWEQYLPSSMTMPTVDKAAQTSALRDMYSDMLGYGQEYNKQVFKLIDEQARKYRNLGILEDTIDKWAKAAKKKRLDEQALLTRNSLEGMAGNWATFFKYLGEKNKKYYKAYKLMAQTEALINTYSAAIAAYKSAAAIPVVGFVLGPIAAAAAIAAGMAQVAAIKAQTFHQGGIIGQSATPVRTVMPAVFDNAPRAHDGLLPDEVPIIAKKDEGIFTPAQMKALGGGGSSIKQGDTYVIMNNPTFQDLATQRRVFAQIAAEITDRVAPGAVVRSYDNDGPIRSRVRNRS